MFEGVLDAVRRAVTGNDAGDQRLLEARLERLIRQDAGTKEAAPPRPLAMGLGFMPRTEDAPVGALPFQGPSLSDVHAYLNNILESGPHSTRHQGPITISITRGTTPGLILVTREDNPRQEFSDAMYVTAPAEPGAPCGVREAGVVQPDSAALAELNQWLEMFHHGEPGAAPHPFNVPKW